MLLHTQVNFQFLATPKLCEDRIQPEQFDQSSPTSMLEKDLSQHISKYILT
jgi:hypothetical protein